MLESIEISDNIEISHDTWKKWKILKKWKYLKILKYLKIVWIKYLKDCFLWLVRVYCKDDDAEQQDPGGGLDSPQGRAGVQAVVGLSGGHGSVSNACYR